MEAETRADVEVAPAGNGLPPSTWKPEYTERALRFWEQYLQEHDMSGRLDQVAAVDPVTGRVWIDRDPNHILEQREAEGLDGPVYLVRVGSDHLFRKRGGPRRCSSAE